MEPPPDGEGASLATSVLPQLVGGLRAPGAADRAEALGQLAQIVDTSFGEDALVLGEYLRMSGGIDALVSLLKWSTNEPVQAKAAHALMNLSTNKKNQVLIAQKGLYVLPFPADHGTSVQRRSMICALASC